MHTLHQRADALPCRIVQLPLRLHVVLSELYTEREKLCGMDAKGFLAYWFLWLCFTSDIGHKALCPISQRSRQREPTAQNVATQDIPAG